MRLGTTAQLHADLEEAEKEIETLRQQLEEARATNTKLHRRVQQAEAPHEREIADREQTIEILRRMVKEESEKYSELLEKYRDSDRCISELRECLKRVTAANMVYTDQSAEIADWRERAEKAEFECAVLREALGKALNVGGIGIVKRAGYFMCQKCGSVALTREEIKHLSYCPVPSLRALCNDITAGARMLAVVQAAEEYARTRKNAFSQTYNQELYDDWEEKIDALCDAVDALNAQEGGKPDASE